MKKEYKYPSIEMLNVDVMNYLLQTSGEQQPDAEYYGDWLNGKRSNGLWEDNDEEEE